MRKEKPTQGVAPMMGRKENQDARASTVFFSTMIVVTTIACRLCHVAVLLQDLWNAYFLNSLQEVVWSSAGYHGLAGAWAGVEL
jgi:hypothetical protein